MIRTCGLLLALLMGLATGCEADGADEPDPDALRAGLAALVTDDESDAQDPSQDPAYGACFADALLGRTTTVQLRDAGVLDESGVVVGRLPRLPEELAESWVLAQFGCTDFVEKSARAQVAITHGRVDATAYAACLRAALTEEQLRAAVVDTLTGDWDGRDLARFSAAQGDCSADSPDPAG